MLSQRPIHEKKKNEWREIGRIYQELNARTWSTTSLFSPQSY